MKLVRVSSLLIGIMMIIQWAFFLITGNVPELETTPISISFHIFIETITAVMLIMSYFFLKANHKWGKYFAVYTQGMLGYTVVNSAGYFAQLGQWLFIFMFGLLLIISIYNTNTIIKN